MKLFEKIQSGVYTIAEMSANHAGKLENALAIVHAAKDAGADCLKIQTYTADSLTIDCDNEYFRVDGGLWDGYTLYDLYSDAATPYAWQADIKLECERAGLDFLSTPFDKDSADFLEFLNVDAYKIASFELVDIPLIRHVAKKGKPMIVSCGMASVEEIQDAMDAMTGEGLSHEKIVLLRCTSSYPARVDEMNLSTIPDMLSRYGVSVGLSDHTLGTLAPVVAVSLGARVIEKHFCLSRNLENPDSKFSTEPHEFAEMVRQVHDAFRACGNICYEPIGQEKASLNFRRSIFAVADIAEHEIFTEENLRSIRPGQGVSPKYFPKLLGRKSKKAYRRGDPIEASELGCDE